jgi:ribosomal-protein-alanine N-acetyltransferase
MAAARSNKTFMLTPVFYPFPELHTSRLVLRRITVEDADELFLMRSHAGTMQYIGRPLAASVDDALKLIRVIDDILQAGDGITWGISLKGERELIGTIGLWRIVKEHHRAEIGYLLHHDRLRQGYANEALTKVLDYGFSTIRLHSVEANVNPLNEASLRLLDKHGFVREAWFKENYYYNGVFKDSVIYSLLTPFR